MNIRQLTKLITPDMVSFWVPGGGNQAIDLIRGNHGKVIGAHPNVPTIAPPIDQISACDATMDWTVSLGSLSIDTGDKKEGTASIKNTVTSPVIDTWYATTYNPAGSWDWSAKKHILCWIKSDRANTAFTYVRLVIYEGANYRYWNLTFSAGEWMAVKKLLSTGDAESGTSPDLALVDKVVITFQTADTTPFYEKIDDLRVTGHPSLINPSVGWVFGGTDDYIDCGNDKSLAINPVTKKWTMGAWINPSWFKDPLGDSATFLWRNVSYGLRLEDPSRITAFVRDTVGWKTVGELGYNSYNYYFVAGVLNGSRLSLCVNGVEVASIDDVGMPFVSDQSLLIGQQATGEQWFKGSIVLPFIANKAWSQQQVNNFYLATKGLFAPRG